MTKQWFWNLVVVALATNCAQGRPMLGVRTSSTFMARQPSISTFKTLQVRGGEGGVDPGRELLSQENLGAFFAINGLMLGVGWQFATGHCMKLFHNYDVGTPDASANQAVHFAAASMFAYGLISYLTVFKKVIPTKAMGWSLAPIVANLVLRETVTNQSKSSAYKQKTGAIAAVLTICAYSLWGGSGPLSKDVATWIPIILLGSINVSSIVSPDGMMQRLEYVDNFTEQNFKMKFLTQAIGVHSLCHLAQYWALGKGWSTFEAIGLSAAVTAGLGLVVCIIMPNMRKSGAPVEPMLPFVALFSYMAYKMLPF